MQRQIVREEKLKLNWQDISALVVTSFIPFKSYLQSECLQMLAVKPGAWLVFILVIKKNKNMTYSHLGDYG